MKKLITQMREKATPVILSVALLLTGLLSFNSIEHLEGNARVINYTGIIRGATQRLIKKELNHIPDDKLIVSLDKILSGLSEGSSEIRLIKLPDEEYQALLTDMKTKWTEMKSEIALYRNGGEIDPLFQLSEDYFHLADRAVLAAEAYTEKSIQSTREALLYMNFAFIFLAVLNAISVFYQEKRHKKLKEAEEKNRIKSEYLTRLSQEILVPMNEISELVYISDIHTHDLLFANNAGIKTFGIDEKKNLKCYQALQGLDAPCPFCTTPYLSLNENYTWEHTNLLTQRHYLLKDRLVNWEGRLARLEIAFDITDAANEKLKMQNRLKCDQVLLECIRELYRNHDLSQATGYALKLVGKLFQAERSYIFLFHGEYISNAEEWCEEGVEAQIDHLQNLRQSDFSAWIDLFRGSENLIIEDVESLKGTQDIEYELLSKQGIHRLVLVPLERDGSLNGFIGLDNPPQSLLENAAAFLRTFRYFLMLAISRSEDEKQLSKLSYQDTLTSFYNRNRYILDVEALAAGHGSAGAIYLDVNGLKEVNDSSGHDAGDRMLKECAQTIQHAVHTGAFYRIGGDEFVILCANLGKKEFDDIVCALRSAFQRGTCRAAIGAQWTEHGKNIHDAIAAADKHMYADKEAFYRNRRSSGRYRHYGDA